MKLDKGLYQDSTPEEQPIGTYRWALNWVKDTQVALTTEGSVVDLDLGISGTIVGTIVMPDKVIVFSTNAGADEIGIYSEKSDSYTPLLNNSIVSSNLNGTVTGLGLSPLHQIRGIFRYNSYSEIEIVWTDGNTSPKMMYLPDVDSVVDPMETILKYYDNYDINKLNVFQDVTSTEASWEVIDGGALTVDSYVAFYRYVNKDGSATGCYVISNDSTSPIFIGNGLVGGSYSAKANSDIDSLTTKAIKITFSTVDDSFEFIEIGLYKSSTNECVIVGKTSITSTSFLITSTRNGVTLSGGITNLLADIYKYTKVQTLTSLNQQLYLGGLTSEDVILGQKWANAVQLSWVCKWLDFSSPSVDFKNPNTVYKTFQAGEVYAFFIRGVKNERASDWHHIPGRELKESITFPIVTTSGAREMQTFGAPENIKNNDIAATTLGDLVANSVKINSNSKFYQTQDTVDWTTVVEDNTSDTNSGEFGYWENKNETYDGYFSGEDLDIGLTGDKITDNQDVVRHHKFPSYASLQNMINKYSAPSGTLLARTDFTTAPSTNKYDAYSRTFCSVIPQLGVSVDLSGLADIADDYDYFELGYTVRSADDCSVIATDISLFGQYQPIYKGWYQKNGTNATGGGGGPVSSNDADAANALLFTGGNFNNQTGASLSTVLTNGSWIKKVGSVYTEILPNRVHFHTPDLVDQVDFDNDSLGVQADYIDNEVILSTVNLYKQGSNYTPSPVFTANRWDDDSGTRNMGLQFPFSTVAYMNFGRYINLVRDTGGEDDIRAFRFRYQALSNKVYIFDYTVNKIERASDVTSIEGDATKYNIEIQNNGEMLLSRSDNWYPDAFKKQPLSAKFYVAANTGTSTISGVTVKNGFLGPKGIQGGSNHLHVVLQEDDVRKPSEFSKGSSGGAFWASKSIIGQHARVQYYDPTNFDNDNHPDTRFMSLCADWRPDYPTNTSSQGYNYGDMRHNTFLTTLRKFKTNIYTSFATKEVIKTESKIIANGTVFYGDMFLSDVSYVVKGNPSELGDYENTDLDDGSSVAYPYANVNTCLYRFIAPTRKNFNYRKTGPTSLTEFNNFYPNSKFDRDLGQSLFIGEAPQNGSLKPLAMLLDSEFNLTNYLFHNSSIYTKTKVFLNSFPFRILQSLVQAKESSISNWRSFPAANYYDIDKVKGYIVNLQNYDDRLLIHTNQTLLQTRGIGKLDTGDNSIVIGNGGVFEYPPQDVVFDNLGYVGTQHQHSCHLSKIGYSFVDVVRGKVFVYVKDQAPVEISAQGMFKYFRDYLHTATVDKEEGLSEVHVGYDYKFNRLLITCKGVGEIEPFTVSFDGSWISFHSYTPDILVNTATKLYSIFGNKMYMHNSESTVLSLPDQDGIGSRLAEIDYTANLEIVTDQAGRSLPGNQQVLKSFQSFNWRTQVYDLSNNFKLMHNNTFFKARVYNDHQLSEDTALTVTDRFTRGNVREYSGVWNFNQFRDSLDRTGFSDSGIPSFISNPNKGYLLDVNNNLVDSSKFVKRFVDRYAILRLTAIGGSNQLKLIDVDSTFKKVTK